MIEQGFNIMRWGLLVKDRRYVIGQGLLVRIDFYLRKDNT